MADLVVEVDHFRNLLHLLLAFSLAKKTISLVVSHFNQHGRWSLRVGHAGKVVSEKLSISLRNMIKRYI